MYYINNHNYVGFPRSVGDLTRETRPTTFLCILIEVRLQERMIEMKNPSKISLIVSLPIVFVVCIACLCEVPTPRLQIITESGPQYELLIHDDSLDAKITARYRSYDETLIMYFWLELTNYNHTEIHVDSTNISFIPALNKAFKFNTIFSYGINYVDIAIYDFERPIDGKLRLRLRGIFKEDKFVDVYLPETK